MEQLLWRLGGVDGIFLPRNATPLEPKQDTDSAPTFQSDGMSLFGHAVKRSFDIFLSSLLMLLFSPLAALCAILVKREDGGPVIFAQERIGREGKPFQIYKFRSMRVDAESAGSPALYSGEEDPRLTRTGRFLRAHHLDELPQLWNVFKGDMSFIGYRPERQYYIDQIVQKAPHYRMLLKIKPGITSWGEVKFGYASTVDEMVERLK
ncbi:MAG: sugar transferase, partial [Clostridia bacterium]|nr:sugar transferase [Clostridia bacterium]